MQPSDHRVESAASQARVLVVDDDPTMRRMVVEYLGQHSVDAIPASGREEMDDRLAADDPSLVILDLRLGREDGLDLLREIRARSDVPVIITTGHRRDEVDRVVGLELGADDYVIKPFSPRELLARIRAVLRRREAGREHEDVFDRSIDVQILRLRRKLEADPAAPGIVKTERGVGYVFALPVDRL